MDALLSCFPENGTPLVILWDFNILLEKLQSPELTNFFATYDLTLSPSPPTHRAGNQLDLIFTRSRGTSTLCYSRFVAFSLPLRSSPLLSSPHIVTTRHNLKSLSPSTFASNVLSSLPSVERFSQLSTEESSDTPPLWTPSVPSTSDLCDPPSPTPPPCLTADDFVTDCTQKVKDISSSFIPASILPP